MRMNATARVLLGLALGALTGLLVAAWHPALAEQLAGVMHPLGILWLNGLQMTVVPLVLGTLQ